MSEIEEPISEEPVDLIVEENSLPIAEISIPSEEGVDMMPESTALASATIAGEQESVTSEDKEHSVNAPNSSDTEERLLNDEKRGKDVDEHKKSEVRIKQDEVIEKPLPIQPEMPASPALPAQPNLEIEIRFLLDRKRISLTEIRSLAEGKVIPLGCSEFQASVMLQEKIIAQAQLVLVDGHPSVQITKVFSGV